MSIQLKKLLNNNHILKAWSLIFAISWWYILSSALPGTATYAIPLVFYNTTENVTLTAPEQIIVTLKGSRTMLRSLAYDSLTCYVNAQQLENGPNAIQLTHHELSLPNSITLETYSPLNITVTQQS